MCGRNFMSLDYYEYIHQWPTDYTNPFHPFHPVLTPQREYRRIGHLDSIGMQLNENQYCGGMGEES